jgi:uncharacterized SAM-binding protein YcdF (DUF218 family)
VRFSAGFLAVLGGAAVILALFVVNLALAARRGRPSRRVTFALYGTAAAVVVLNFLRGLGTETNYVLAAHAVVLFSIGVSLKRYLEAGKNPGAGGEDPK